MNLNQDTLNALNGLLKTVSLDNVTAESTGFSDLDEGYYFTEVKTAELTISKNSGNPQVKVELKVTEDGYAEDESRSTATTFIYKRLPKSKGRTIFKYYPLTDEASVQRFVNDMLKFEAKPGEPLIPKEAFTSAEDIEDALECLSGAGIVVNVSYKRNEDGEIVLNDKGQKNVFYNPISWQRVEKIQLPMK